MGEGEEGMGEEEGDNGEGKMMRKGEEMVEMIDKGKGMIEKDGGGEGQNKKEEKEEEEEEERRRK